MTLKLEIEHARLNGVPASFAGAATLRGAPANQNGMPRRAARPSLRLVPAPQVTRQRLLRDRFTVRRREHFLYQLSGRVAPYSTPDRGFLIDSLGREHVFAPLDFELDCQPGHELTLVWAIERRRKFGPYVMAHNHTTGQTGHAAQALEELCRMQVGQLGAVLLLGLLVASCGMLPLMLLPLVPLDQFLTRRRVEALGATLQFG
jgi:hypothetical protein